MASDRLKEIRRRISFDLKTAWGFGCCCDGQGFKKFNFWNILQKMIYLQKSEVHDRGSCIILTLIYFNLSWTTSQTPKYWLSPQKPQQIPASQSHSQKAKMKEFESLPIPSNRHSSHQRPKFIHSRVFNTRGSCNSIIASLIYSKNALKRPQTNDKRLRM